MSSSEYFLRAFRPSRLALREEQEYELLDKQANLERYVLRAQSGLPLFEKASDKRDRHSRKKR